MHLELPVAGLAAQRRSESDLRKLDSALVKFEKTSDPRHRSAVDADFHLGIARASGNGLFVRLIEDLRQQLQDQAQAVSAPDRAIQAAREHRSILEAIHSQDKAKAVEAMREHLESVELSMRKQTGLPMKGQP
jgi:DNA-binding FadR family transcriptional regulator